MKNITLATLIALLITTTFAQAAVNDDPLLSKYMLDQFEADSQENKTGAWSGQAWFGYDLKKITLKTEGEFEDGKIEDAELQALYSQAVAPNWDVQVGFKKDFKPTPTQTWGVVALQGLAPYFFEVDTSLFFTEQGDTALRLEAEYELLLTQKWILTPEVEVNFFGQNDIERGTGSGLSDIETGLRLRYEVTREFAPYIGINKTTLYGNTADFNDDASDTQLVIGFKAWF